MAGDCRGVEYVPCYSHLDKFGKDSKAVLIICEEWSQKLFAHEFGIEEWSCTGKQVAEDVIPFDQIDRAVFPFMTIFLVTP